MASTYRSRQTARDKPGLSCSMDQVRDDDDRRYQPISLDIVGEETGKERYARRDQDEDVDVDRDPVGGPLVASWRHNLVGPCPPLRFLRSTLLYILMLLRFILICLFSDQVDGLLATLEPLLCCAWQLDQGLCPWSSFKSSWPV